MKNVNFHSCLKVDNKIWFVSVEGYLMNFDIITYQSEIVVPNNLSKMHFKVVVDNMISTGNMIYFVEQDGSKLYEYNSLTNGCTYYLIPDTEYINWGCFSGIYLYGKTIYLFTRCTNIIYCFDIISKKFTSITTAKKYIVLNSFRTQNRIYLYGEKVLCFDMDKNFYEEECCLEVGNIFWMNSYQKSILFLEKNRIGIWNPDYKLTKSVYEEEGLAEKFLTFFATEHKIFLLPNGSTDIFTLNPETGDLSYVIPPRDLYYIEKGWSKYWGYTEEENYIWCANRVSNYVLSIDKKYEEIRWIKLKKPDLKSEIPYLRLLDKQFFDESEMTLEQFLLVNNTGLQKSECSYGEKIWRNLS